MKKHILIILLTNVVFFTAKSQQTPLYNQHFINPYVYNPSYIGFNDGVNVTAIRNQKWSDYNGGFITNYFTVGTLLKGGKSGLGLDLYSDYVGLSSKLKAHLAYSYKIKLADNMFLRAGLSAGVIDNRINFSGAVVTDVADPILNGAQIKDKKTMFDMNFGLNYTFNDFYFGIGIPQTIGSKLHYDSLKTLSYTLERQYVANTGYKFMVNKAQKISITPDLLAIYTPNIPLNYNASLIFDWEKYGWIAATYKSDYAIGANIGISLVKNLKIGLAYDIQINEVASKNQSPNFEILLQYKIPQFSKIDTLIQHDTIVKIELVEQKPQIKEVVNLDSINALNYRIKQLEDSLKAQNKKPKSNSSLTKKDGVFVKTNPDDHFIEILDKTDSPNGYYVVVGAFGRKDLAEKLLKTSKQEFPNARLIFNERNNLYYIILVHSTNFNTAKKAYTKSRQLEGGRFYKAWILDYKKRR